MNQYLVLCGMLVIGFLVWLVAITIWIDIEKRKRKRLESTFRNACIACGSNPATIDVDWCEVCWED